MRSPAQTERPILDEIRRRFSTKAFDPNKDLTPETVATLFEAARWAPSSLNEQPWRYLIFTKANPDPRRKAEACLNSGNAPAKNAPLLLLSFAKRSLIEEDRRNRFHMHDLGMANLSLVIQAVGMGLVTLQMGGYDQELARASFGISSDFTLGPMIAVGHYGDAAELDAENLEEESLPRMRRPLTDTAFDGALERPFEFGV